MAKKIDKDTGEIIDELTLEPIGLAPGEWKTPFNHDTAADARNTGTNCKDPSLAQKQFQNDADINVILAKFLNTGQMNVNGDTPIYGDVPENRELIDNVITKAQVEEAWGRLPTAAQNILKDPKTLTDYVTHCMQTGDLDPLRELGLANKLPEPGAPPPTPLGGDTTDSEKLSVGTLANK